jgi:hypothetical protein
LPPIIFGVLDKDVSAETLLALPELYKSGQNSEVRSPGKQGKVAQLLPELPLQFRETTPGWGSEALCSSHHSATCLLNNSFPGLCLICH